MALKFAQPSYYLSFVLLFVSCNSMKEKDKTANHKEIYTDYQEFPAFIKNYLDSLEGGKFLIANPGKQWQQGCVVFDNTLDKQLITASLDEEYFTLNYRQGGWGVSVYKMTLFLKHRRVQGHTRELL